ncbi:expressed unknown protein [Seminavis robusta]|uniref:Uncharacterized protein n=1 Tax=Seminavis robusta TaxID=568900 RepID=A0A9N8DJA7_9STRA|nr:expressed unknown protein [Seminavis robusta]|eukprot:Sro173_g076200.1 n/a (289) ;mRNA; f:18930-19796
MIVHYDKEKQVFFSDGNGVVDTSKRFEVTPMPLPFKVPAHGTIRKVTGSSSYGHAKKSEVVGTSTTSRPKQQAVVKGLSSPSNRAPTRSHRDHQLSGTSSTRRVGKQNGCQSVSIRRDSSKPQRHPQKNQFSGRSPSANRHVEHKHDTNSVARRDCFRDLHCSPLRGSGVKKAAVRAGGVPSGVPPPNNRSFMAPSPNKSNDYVLDHRSTRARVHFGPRPNHTESTVVYVKSRAAGPEVSHKENVLAFPLRRTRRLARMPQRKKTTKKNTLPSFASVCFVTCSHRWEL